MVDSGLNSPQYDLALLADCGEDVFISAAVEIRLPHLVKVGSHVAIDTGFYCTTRFEIGDYCHLGPYITVVGGADGFLQMGHFTTIAAGSRIVSVGDNHMGDGLVGPTIPVEYQDSRTAAPVVFKNYASIATNVVVTPGVTLGEGSVVGANSLVTRDTEPWTVYIGTPAKPLKPRPREEMLRAARALGYKEE